MLRQGQARAACEWTPVCGKPARGEPIRGKRYCKHHARKVAGEALAVALIEDYRDIDVPTHRGSNLRDQQCEYCGSFNFIEEKVGQGNKKHYNICCRNGKCKNLREEHPA